MAFENKIIWKAIETINSKVLGKGTSEFNKQLFNNILNSYQNESKSVILELYDIGCKERIGYLSAQQNDINVK